MLKKILQKKENLLLLLILLVGAFLRLYRIADYMTFLGDEGRDVLVVKRLIVDHHIPFLGPTASVGGFFLGPIYYYLMTPFLWLFGLNPVGPAVMVALFGIATIHLLYLTCETFFNKKAAIFASSLYALSPLVIAYSRSSWNPNLVPFFSLLLIYSLYKAVNSKNRIWFLIIGLCIGVGLQLHYLFTFLVPVALVFLLINQERIGSYKPYLLIGTAFVILMFPFLAFEVKNHFPNFHSLFNFLMAGKEVSTKGDDNLGKMADLIFRLYGRLVFYFPPPERLYLYVKGLVWFWTISIVITIISSFVLIVLNLKKDEKGIYKLLLLWLLFGIGLFYFYQKAIYDYYFGIMFTLPFILCGNLFSFSSSKKYLLPIGMISFLALIVLNWSGRPFQYPPNKQLAQAERTARFVLEKTENKPYNFALITGQNSDHAYRYFLEIWGHPPITIENSQKDPERKTVTNQLLIICEVSDCKPLGNSLWEVAGFGRAEIAGNWEVGVLKVFRLIPYKQ